MITTSFEQCRKAKACRSSYLKMIKALGSIKNHGRYTRTPLIDIYPHLGFEDALWVLRNASGPEGLNIGCLFGADAAERVLPIFEKEFPGGYSVIKRLCGW